MMRDLLPSMWFQPGFRGNDVLVVLNSPGRDELLSNHPAVGKTGHNLEILLSKIVGVDSRWPLCRRSVEIINASRVPHYKDAPDGECVRESEVLANVEFGHSRLTLLENKTILVFGNHARTLVEKVFSQDADKCICFCRHLDDRALINDKMHGGLRYPWPDTPDGRGVVEWRIECLARFIMDSWGQKGIHDAAEYFNDLNL